MPLSNDTILRVAKATAGSTETVEHHGDFTLVVKKEDLINVLTELKNNPETSFEMLLDITAIDWAKGEERFSVYYFLYSLKHNARARVMVSITEAKPHLPTAVEIWESANWYERETYDMYGVIFDGHPDPRRFFMPEDFVDEEGESLYPMRKEFPLGGIPGSMPLPAKD